MLTTTTVGQLDADLSAELVAAFSATGIDLGTVRTVPDGTVVVELADGGRIAIGEEDGWITACRSDEDGEAYPYEGTSLAGLAAAVAHATRA